MPLSPIARYFSVAACLFAYKIRISSKKVCSSSYPSSPPLYHFQTMTTSNYSFDPLEVYQWSSKSFLFSFHALVLFVSHLCNVHDEPANNSLVMSIFRLVINLTDSFPRWRRRRSSWKGGWLCETKHDDRCVSLSDILEIVNENLTLPSSFFQV